MTTMIENLPTQSSVTLKDDNNHLRQLSLADLDDATDVASRAFHNFPLWQYLLKGDTKRAKLLPKFYRAFLAYGIRRGQVYGVSNPIEGIAVWSPPGQNAISLRGLANADVLHLFFGSSLIPALKSARIFAKFEPMQKTYAPEPHFQLRSVAVSPDSQGKGLASKLIKPFLAQADERAVSVYTETTALSNVGFYEHYGFECREQLCLKGTGLSISALYRPTKR
jgi:ribosomal protein S18 acetylase RimI-like enzyme